MRRRRLKLSGWGKALPDNRLQFGDQIRYRLKEGETLIQLAERAVGKALKRAQMEMGQIDCIVCAAATPLQALPCNAALIHERIAGHLDIPAMDINTSCTSFLTALDIVSCMVELGRYRTVLIVSGDSASSALNPAEKESYELFSDAASAFVVTRAGEGESSEILYSAQKTWSAGAHDTEIKGGGGLMSALKMTEENREAYYFHMNGPKVLKLSAKVLPGFIEECMKNACVLREELQAVIPHQASRALGIIMPRLGFPEGSYINRVREYGNMVSASVPYTLCRAIEDGDVRRGGLVLLMGTAAGLTANAMILRF